MGVTSWVVGTVGVHGGRSGQRTEGGREHEQTGACCELADARARYPLSRRLRVEQAGKRRGEEASAGEQRREERVRESGCREADGVGEVEQVRVGVRDARRVRRPVYSITDSI
jgi:hypothetical protein